MITVLPAALAVARANIADTFLTEVENQIVIANNYGFTSTKIAFPFAFTATDRTTVMNILNGVSYVATQEILQNNYSVEYPTIYVLKVVW